LPTRELAWGIRTLWKRKSQSYEKLIYVLKDKARYLSNRFKRSFGPPKEGAHGLGNRQILLTKDEKKRERSHPYAPNRSARIYRGEDQTSRSRSGPHREKSRTGLGNSKPHGVRLKKQEKRGTADAGVKGNQSDAMLLH